MNPDWSEQDCRRNGNRGLFTRVQDPEERRAFSEAEEGPVIEAVYTQEEICDQEWCGRIMENTELAICDSKESPELEAVRIKEEAVELECVHITEEVSKDSAVINPVNIVKLESSHCGDCPPELVCVRHNQRVSEDTCSSVGEEDTGLGSIQGTPCWGAAPSTSSTAYPGRRNSAPAPQSKISTDGGLQRKQKRRETTPQDEWVPLQLKVRIQDCAIAEKRSSTTRRWRHKIKQNPELYEQHKRKEAARARLYRLNQSPMKKKIQKEKARERARKCRERQKNEKTLPLPEARSV
ncbi:uncharacterized protein LOC121305971 isoform X2 [Polyodon spathula]|uniref:uncharacterized protein LOC121305971 isoform X2 n=1 Tax=Polyodon spathula TaxID=7913 RepID=UPI001B7F714C|nr:uncharacterized protein LOC121305971 isoform X2 [Polyodon spathula]